MRRDLERIIRERGLGGAVVFAYDRYSRSMYYVTGARLGFGVYVLAADRRARLVYDGMETEAAAASGLERSGCNEVGPVNLFAEEGASALAFENLTPAPYDLEVIPAG